MLSSSSPSFFQKQGDAFIIISFWPLDMWHLCPILPREWSLIYEVPSSCDMLFYATQGLIFDLWKLLGDIYMTMNFRNCYPYIYRDRDAIVILIYFTFIWFFTTDFAGLCLEWKWRESTENSLKKTNDASVELFCDSILFSRLASWIMLSLFLTKYFMT